MKMELDMKPEVISFSFKKWIGLLAICMPIVSACAIEQPRDANPVAKEMVQEASGCELMPDRDRSTIVIYVPSSETKLVCNAPRSRERFIPASTYKIPHSLIALEVGAVDDENQKFQWDGRGRGVDAWNTNTSMADAVSASTVWVFQEIADKIGQPREQEWVEKLEYGNANVGSADDLRHFWLRGPLKISAEEQVAFLQRLHNGQLNADASSMTRTIRMIQSGQAKDGSIIYGKTGAMLPIDDEGFLRSDTPGLLPNATERTGWFVGWIERPVESGGPVYFALNLDLELPNTMRARTKATYALLKSNGFPVPNAIDKD
ncbi:class D beta-lactamase [Salinicola corii]|nr:class D beta-lactamase [Salinicola corii]